MELVYHTCTTAVLERVEWRLYTILLRTFGIYLRYIVVFIHRTSEEIIVGIIVQLVIRLYNMI